MLRITVSERDTDIGGDLTCMYAVAFGQRTGENHHTYGTLLQVYFATWAVYFSPQSSTILLYLTLAVCPFSLYPHFCMRTLHRPVDVLRQFRQDQKGQASLEHDGRDSLGLRWELCGAVWR